MSEPPGSPREARVPDEGAAEPADPNEEPPRPEEDRAPQETSKGPGDETEARTEDRRPHGYEPL